MLGKINSAVEVLREKWRESRIPPNRAVFSSLLECAERSAPARKGIEQYLEDYSSLGEISVQRDWYRDEETGEMRLDYHNSLFAPGCLRFNPGKKDCPVIVYLPGNLTGAEQVMAAPGHPQYLAEAAADLGYGIACWDWPLQGRRRGRGLYKGFRTVYSIEREYSRVLPSLGSCLWREMVAELRFALEQIVRLTGAHAELQVVGWSMGACFAYVAPLLSSQVGAVVAAGSCAAIGEMLEQGETRVHGYFFYPLDGLAYFDLEDTVAAALERGECRMLVLFGDRDGGCFPNTAQALGDRAAGNGSPLRVTVLADHGHSFSPRLKETILNFLVS